jgi:hypothetical protein
MRQEYFQRLQWVLAGVVIAAALLAIVFWVARELSTAEKIQKCVLEEHKDCFHQPTDL